MNRARLARLNGVGAGSRRRGAPPIETRELRAGPLVVRLEGSNVEKGKQLLKESRLTIIAADDLAGAAEKAIAVAKPSGKRARRIAFMARNYF